MLPLRPRRDTYVEPFQAFSVFHIVEKEAMCKRDEAGKEDEKGKEEDGVESDENRDSK